MTSPNHTCGPHGGIPNLPFPAIMFVLAGKVAAPSVAHSQPSAYRNPWWRACRVPFDRHQSGFGPRTAPECSLTFVLTKPRVMGIVTRQACVRGRKGAAHAEPVTVRPPLAWSFHSNKMSLPGRAYPIKMLFYDDQSQYVYENKRHMDRMTAKESDIYGNSTRILQKNSQFDGQFVLIGTFKARFGGFSRQKSPSVARRAQHKICQHGESSQPGLRQSPACRIRTELRMHHPRIDP